MLDSSQDVIVSETAIVDKILKFDAFERFYNAEWEPRKLSGSMVWKINPTCDGFAEQGIDETNDKLFIRLRKCPLSYDDAFLSAHEMVHAMDSLDGKQLKIAIYYDNIIIKRYGEKEIRDLAWRIGSMFDDPIVDLFLQEKYNFDPVHFYTKVKIPYTIRSINSSIEAANDLYRLKQALLYSQFALHFDSIKSANALYRWRRLKNLYQVKRPKVKIIGEMLYSMIKEEGYDTIEKQRLILKKIGYLYTIDGIKLNDILTSE